MRSAEEIKEGVEISAKYSMADGLTDAMVIDMINLARKETILTCASKAIFTRVKVNILSLIKELK